MHRKIKTGARIEKSVSVRLALRMNVSPLVLWPRDSISRYSLHARFGRSPAHQGAGLSHLSLQVPTEYDSKVRSHRYSNPYSDIYSQIPSLYLLFVLLSIAALQTLPQLLVMDVIRPASPSSPSRASTTICDSDGSAQSARLPVPPGVQDVYVTPSRTTPSRSNEQQHVSISQ